MGMSSSKAESTGNVPGAHGRPRGDVGLDPGDQSQLGDGYGFR